MRINFIFTCIISILLLSSCKEELIMVPDFEVPPSDRKVLLEELTGVRCPNCPSGAAQVKNLQEIYGDRLIAVGIHGGFLTIPLGESKYDFQNDYARELESFLEVGPKPAAALNRVRHLQEEFSISTPSLWSQYVDDELKKENEMNIILTNTYDPETRKLDIIVTAIPLKDFSQDENLRISIMISQNDIEDAQEDPYEVLEDYVHNHVLRTMLTAAKGDVIQKDLVANQAENFTFSFTLPKDEDLEEMEAPWVAEHVEVIAFLNVIDGDDKHIIQVEASHITD